jgi:hypothetical protein
MMIPCVDRLRQWIRRMNIFESGSVDEETVQIERWSSWIYIVLFIAILEILSMYTGLGHQTTTVTINDPSYTTFESLQQKYPLTLQCPCSITSSQLSTFVQTDVTYHQVIILRFVSDFIKLGLSNLSRLSKGSSSDRTRYVFILNFFS